MSNIRNISRLSEVISNYKVILVDQWGVMHNGHNSFPQALQCLEQCVSIGCKVISISNSSRKKTESEQLLSDLGFVKNIHYHDVVTSGETVYQRLPYYLSKYGKHVWSINWTSEEPLLADSPFIKEYDQSEADWILCSGVPIGYSIKDFHPLLLQAIDKNIPLVCANPDILTLSVDNKLNNCPGAFAVFYENQGGKVYWHGKPLSYIYEYALKLSKDNITDKATILGIGDSIFHDIAGINNFGGSSCLITSGIHRDVIIQPTNQQHSIISQLSKEAKTTPPKYIIENLVW